VQPFRRYFQNRVLSFYTHSLGVVMSYRSCTTCKVLLATISLWANLCSSLRKMTESPSSSFNNTRQLNENAQTSSELKLAEATSNAANTSYSSIKMGDLSSSQNSGCSYILGYATLWPGPYVVTRTDSIICPSLASKMITCTQCTNSNTDYMQHPQCLLVSMQLQPFRMVMACTTAQNLRPAVHTTILPATRDVLMSLRHAAVNGPSGLLRTASFYLSQQSHPLLSLQRRSHRKVTLIPTLLCRGEKLTLRFNTLSQSANQL
jgi:hypothetical protein